MFRSALLMGLSLLAIFGSKKADWSGSGPLAVLTLAFVAGLRWRKETPEGENVSGCGYVSIRYFSLCDW